MSDQDHKEAMLAWNESTAGRKLAALEAEAAALANRPQPGAGHGYAVAMIEIASIVGARKVGATCAEIIDLVRTRCAPVPPAGDVEVLGYASIQVESRRVYEVRPPFLPFCQSYTEWLKGSTSKIQVVELIDRAHVTRLTAERDTAIRAATLGAENLNKALETADGLRAELTKARELNAEVTESVTGRRGTFARIPADWFDRREAFAHNVDESCGQDAEAAKCARCEASTVESCDEKGCGFLGAGNGAPAAKGEPIVRDSLLKDNQRITPARFKCLACGEYHEGMSGLPCPNMTPYAQVKP